MRDGDRAARARPGDVEVLAAVKYVAARGAGRARRGRASRSSGENRAQELEAKAGALGAELTWDFIGHLQSRKVKQVLPHVRWIHSVASDSVARAARAPRRRRETEVLVEVNVAGEEGKSGVAPGELDAFLERCPVRVVGPDDDAAARRATPRTAAAGSPRWRELAGERGLRELSMGTTPGLRGRRRRRARRSCGSARRSVLA